MDLIVLLVLGTHALPKVTNNFKGLSERKQRHRKMVSLAPFFSAAFISRDNGIIW